MSLRAHERGEDELLTLTLTLTLTPNPTPNPTPTPNPKRAHEHGEDELGARAVCVGRLAQLQRAHLRAAQVLEMLDV